MRQDEHFASLGIDAFRKKHVNIFLRVVFGDKCVLAGLRLRSCFIQEQNEQLVLLMAKNKHEFQLIMKG